MVVGGKDKTRVMGCGAGGGRDDGGYGGKEGMG